jgi:hypothetical protein
MFRGETLKPAATESVGVSGAARRLSVPLKTLANRVRAAAKTDKLKSAGQHGQAMTQVESSAAAACRT